MVQSILQNNEKWESYEDMNSYQFSQNWEQVESLMDYNEEAIQHN